MLIKICLLLICLALQCQASEKWNFQYIFPDATQMKDPLQLYSVYCTDDDAVDLVDAECQCAINDTTILTLQDSYVVSNPSNFEELARKPILCQDGTKCKSDDINKACNKDGRDKLIHSVCDMVACADEKSATISCKNRKTKCIICAGKEPSQKSKNMCKLRSTLNEEINNILATGEQTPSAIKKNMTVSLLEKFDANYSTTLVKQNITDDINLPNLDIRVTNITNNVNTTISFNNSLTKVTIPPNKKTLQNITVVVARWKGIAKYLNNEPNLPPTCFGDRCPFFVPSNTSLITVNIYNRIGDQVMLMNDHGVKYTMDLTNDLSVAISKDRLYRRVTNVKRQCAWWNETHWSTQGCQSIGAEDLYSDDITCSCNHTTNFGSLLTIESVEPPGWVYNIEMQLQLVTIVFLSVTIIFVILARLSKALPNQPQSINRSNVRNNRTITQLCLCISLIGLHVLLIISDEVQQYPNLCYTCAAFIHVFLLAAAMWLLNEGLALVLKTSTKFLLHLNYKFLTIIQLLAGWLFPVLIVGITIIAAQENYIKLSDTYRHFDRNNSKFFPQYVQCIPNTNRNYWIYKTIITFLGAIVGTNVILIFRTIYVVYHVSKKDNRLRYPESMNCGSNCTIEDHYHRYKHWSSVLKAFMILLPISSIPWIMWMLTIVPDAQLASTFVQIHIIVDGLQGLGIFIVYCLMNTDDKTRIREQWNRSSLKRSLSDCFSSVKIDCCYRRHKSTLEKQQPMYGSTELKSMNVENHNERFDSNVTTISHLSP